jgi:hypothetical protein
MRNSLIKILNISVYQNFSSCKKVTFVSVYFFIFIVIVDSLNKLLMSNSHYSTSPPSCNSLLTTAHSILSVTPVSTTPTLSNCTKLCVYVQPYYSNVCRIILTIKHSTALTFHQSAVCCHADGSVSCDITNVCLNTIYITVTLQITKPDTSYQAHPAIDQTANMGA